MTYKHKSKPGVTCTVIDMTSSFVIYQYVQDGIKLTNKTRASSFNNKWEVV